MAFERLFAQYSENSQSKNLQPIDSSSSAKKYSGEYCVVAEKTIPLRDLQIVHLPVINLSLAAPLQQAVFIDAGSMILFTTPSRVIGIIRVCAVHTAGLQRTRIERVTYLVSITQECDAADDEVFLSSAEPIGQSDERIEQCLTRTITKKEIADASREFNLSTLLDTLRTLAERAFAPFDGVVVFDGSIRTTNRYLQNHLLYREHEYALAKSSSLVTNKHRPLGAAIKQIVARTAGNLSKTNTLGWSVSLGAAGGALLSCVQLHASSKHVFLLEGNARCDEKSLASIASLLASWSCDAAFLGYPYPLLLADQLARVTMQEQATWKALLATNATVGPLLFEELRSSDAHATFEHILYGKGF